MSEEEIERQNLIDSIPFVADIDCYKENIKPRRQGRDASILALNPTQRIELQDTKNAKYEELLLTLDEQDDPLAIYLEYIEWTIEMYPGDDTQLHKLLKDATTRFVEELRYKHDPRYLKIWLEYANIADLPTNVYSYLMSTDIGQSLALFYEEYAAFLERKQKYNEAEIIFEKGIKQNAAPLVRLEKNFKRFQKRMEERKAMGISTKHTPAYKQQMEALRATGKRTMLGEKIGDRSVAHKNFTGFGGGKHTLSTPSFHVYSDDGITEDSYESQISSPNISLVHSSFKKIENEIVKEKFAGAILPKVKSTLPKKTFEKFTVYRDPDPDNTPSSSFNKPLTEESKSLKKQRLSDTNDKRLVQRFTDKGSKYFRTKDSKGNTEYICVDSFFEQNISYEEYKAMKKKKSEAITYESSTTKEDTIETKAARESINSILHNEEEEDLTWTRDIQEFMPIQRKHTSEND